MYAFKAIESPFVELFKSYKWFSLFTLRDTRYTAPQSVAFDERPHYQYSSQS